MWHAWSFVTGDWKEVDVCGVHSCGPIRREEHRIGEVWVDAMVSHLRPIVVGAIGENGNEKLKGLNPT